MCICPCAVSLEGGSLYFLRAASSSLQNEVARLEFESYHNQKIGAYGGAESLSMSNKERALNSSETDLASDPNTLTHSSSVTPGKL